MIISFSSLQYFTGFVNRGATMTDFHAITGMSNVSAQKSKQLFCEPLLLPPC